MERTFSIIKPNSTEQNHIGKIITMMENVKLSVVDARMTTLTKEEAEGFYAEHKERPFYNSLVSFMTSGRVMLLVLEGDNAIENYRNLMGATDPAKAAPQTIRKLFANSIEANSVHGSDSPASADREIKYFFK